MKSWYTHQFTTVFLNDFSNMQFDFKVRSGRKWTIIVVVVVVVVVVIIIIIISLICTNAA